MIVLDIYQDTACYRIHELGNPIIGFPLVPPSTIYGMLRHITKKKDYLPISPFNGTRLAISGKNAGIFTHIVRNLLVTANTAGEKESKSNVIPTMELYQPNHKIIVESPFENEILDAVDSTAIRMGRSDDLIISASARKIINVETVSEVRDPKIFSNYINIDGIPYYMYAPYDCNKGTLFRLPRDGDKALLDQGVLKMHKIKCFYISVHDFIFTRASNVEKHSATDETGERYLFTWIS